MGTEGGGPVPLQAPMPEESKITESDITYGTIEHTLEVLPLEDLLAAADTIQTLSGVRIEKPLKECTVNRLRVLLIECVQSIYENDPEMLPVIGGFVDAIGRARLKRSLGDFWSTRGDKGNQ